MNEAQCELPFEICKNSKTVLLMRKKI